MKIWILEPVKGLNAKNNPWEPWYDKAFGFTIAADSEERAREIAQENGGDEVGYTNKNQVWTNPLLATCKELLANEEKVLMRDFAAA